MTKCLRFTIMASQSAPLKAQRDALRQQADSIKEQERAYIRQAVESLERTVSALMVAHRAALIEPAKAKALDDRILLAVGDEFGVSPAAIMGRRRDAHIVIARHVAIYLTRKWTGLSYPVLAQQFGHRDHTSALHSDHLVHRRRQVDAGFAQRVARIEAELNAQVEQQERQARQRSHVLEIVDRIERQRLKQTCTHRVGVGHQQKRMAISLRLGHQVCRNDAASAGAVINHHRLPQTFRHLLRHGSRCQVRHATGAKRHNDTQRFCRIALGLHIGYTTSQDTNHGQARNEETTC